MAETKHSTPSPSLLPVLTEHEVNVGQVGVEAVIVTVEALDVKWVLVHVRVKQVDQREGRDDLGQGAGHSCTHVCVGGGEGGEEEVSVVTMT